MTVFKPLLAGSILLGFSLAAAATPMHFHAPLSQLNDSGVSGTANLTYHQDTSKLDVHISATGLQTGQVHPQHIHGPLSNGKPVQAKSPTLAQDNNNDGVIELNEGGTTYGPILIPLTSPPGGALSGFPTAPDGTIDFSQSYDLTNSGIYNDGFGKNDVLPLSLREIVLHGMTAPVDIPKNLNGRQAFTKGDYDPLLPVASGVLAANTAVPEPSDLGMILFALALIGGLVAVRRRRHGGLGKASRAC
jgi:hypothetical protein